MRRKPFPKAFVAAGRIEQAPDDKLRRHGAVPVVLGELERQVIAARAAQTLDLRSQPERNRATAIAPMLLHPEAKVLAVTDGGRLDGLDARRQENRLGIAEPERRKPAQLVGEIERQAR